ncbi:murein hydrolase activator EnvC family protein [Asticcacaulis taihuensis]|uniref:murein hydrolase activator EnvC family protein n=1 Tax=Asticcacaulis taihuensis TaxID=260084 RepID=UPI003F7BEE6D
MLASSRHLLLTGLAVLALAGAVQSDAQQRTHDLSEADRATLDTLSAQRRAEERKSDTQRRSARQIAQEVEALREQIIEISKKQGTGETRSAIYRAKLETINQQETDISRRLIAERDKQTRLLSALQIYSRNPPPALFVTPRTANDAVLAAIIMRAITPELKKRTESLVRQNSQLVNLRRQAALQNEAIFISESEVSEQRTEIERLIQQKMDLEDQLLNQADQMDARAAELKARENRLTGDLPLKFFGSPAIDNTHLQPPVVGDITMNFGQTDGKAPASRGVSYAALPGSQVTAPAEGEVEYAGPLDSYGQVVVLSIGHDYRVVVTGIGRIYVQQGQTVGRHEPLGRMPNLSDKKTLLYMELRKGETPVNPATPLQLSSR